MRTLLALWILLVIMALVPTSVVAAETAEAEQDAPSSIPDDAANNDPVAADPDFTAMEPAPAPGETAQRNAEMLETRDEVMSAQLEYLDAFGQVVEAALAGGEDAPALWARAEFLLEKVVELVYPTGNSADPLAAISAQLAVIEPKRIAPLFTARLRWMQARLLLQQGKGEPARHAVEPLGLLTDWMLLGPLDNQRGRSFDLPTPAEDWPPDPALTLPGVKHPATWRRHSSRSPLGFIALDALMQPNTECLSYALCLVYSPATQDAALRYGSDDGIALWVNGVEQARNPAERSADLDQGATPVHLQQGWNALLLKVAQHTDEWGFFCRLTDPAGNPLPGLKTIADPAQIIAHLPTIKPATEPATHAIGMGAQGWLAERLALVPESYPEAYMLGYLLMQRRQLGVHERDDIELLQAAAEGLDNRSICWIAFAQAGVRPGATIPDREENYRRRALGSARALSERETYATALLAEYYLNHMKNFTRAQELIDQALLFNPMSPRAQLLLCDLYRHHGWDEQAQAVVDKLIERSSTSPDAHMRQGLLAYRAGQLQKAEAAFARTLAINATLDEARRSYVRVLRSQGRLPDAVQALRRFHEQDPYERWITQMLVETLRRMTRFEEALAVADEWLAGCPDDHEMLAERGHCLSGMNKLGPARQAWHRALALQPSFPALRGYLEAVDGKQHEEEDIDLAALAARAPPASDFPGADLLHLRNDIDQEVHADGTRRRTHHRILKILTEAGVDTARHTRIWADGDLETITVHSARVLHADGSTGEAEQAQRRRGNYVIKVVVMPPLQKGDLIDLKYSVDRFKSDFFGDYFGQTFLFQQTAPTLEASYTLTTPASLPIHVHTTGDAPTGTETPSEDGKLVARRWQMHDLPAIVEEPNMPPLKEISPSVQVSTFESWDALARWYWHLIKSQNVITQPIRDQVEMIASGEPDDTDKLRAVFHWVSHEIRNVAWAFGVHGYKPYSANTIFARRFGDCKDKSTMINVMSRDLGFDAWPVLVHATDPGDNPPGRGREDLSLPILNHFNHCISYVTIGDESRFLDGTISYRTIDGQHFSTAGAEAVIVRPDGAERVRIPAQGPEDNRWEGTMTISLDKDGSAAIEQSLLGTGHLALYMRAYFGRPEARNFVLRRLADRYYGEAVNAEARIDPKVGPDTVGLTGRIRMRTFAHKEGTRLRVPIPKAFLRGKVGQDGAIPDELSTYAQHSSRVHDVILPLPFRVQRKITFSLPTAWRLVSGVRSVEIDEPFGALRVHQTRIGSTITVEYLLEIRTPRIPVEQYPAFRRLCILADQIDQSGLVVETAP